MTVFDKVRDYHIAVGDDFGHENTRHIRYDAALSLFPATYESLLDVGCGSGRFRLWWNGHGSYTGIDLLQGQNVLDHHDHHDVVVALGVLYRVSWEVQSVLISHMWGLAEKALVVQTLCFPRDQVRGEHPVDPLRLFRLARTLTDKVQLRTDYLDGRDITIGLYR